MERGMTCWLALALAMVMWRGAPCRAQINTPCNASVMNAFSPCMNFLTNSTSNSSGSSSPTTQCCNSLKSLTSGGMDCLCLVVTGSVPFRIPINRTLAISLPRACNMPGVPLQCKSTGSPVPAPGPLSLGPSSSPASSPSAPSGLPPSASPQGSSILPSPTTPSPAPQADTPPSPSVDTGTPSAASGGRTSDLTPSSAISSSTFSHSFLLIPLALVALNYY